MKANGINIGDPFYGINFSRIDYQRIGSVATGLYGYSISYLYRDESFEREE
ncbi:MAG TPA: hypothetical protein PLK12_16040 [Prolixibacteraceae bacterium]|nr:hypothetical protein [Prolixibacteraceae bacterium]